MTRYVVLAAGEGSRMRERTSLPKPLVEVGDRALLGHVLDRIAETDVSAVTVVVGYQHERVEAFLDGTSYDFPVETVVNPDYERENGFSLQRAAATVDGPFVLAMADHIVDPEIYRRAGRHDGLGLCTDDSPPPGEDEDEATTVQVEDGRIVAIGKDLREWDAVDTGVFRLAPEIFEALEERTSSYEVTVTDGVRELIARGRDVETIDVAGCRWVDVDTPDDLRIAERVLANESGG